MAGAGRHLHHRRLHLLPLGDRRRPARLSRGVARLGLLDRLRDDQRRPGPHHRDSGRQLALPGRSSGMLAAERRRALRRRRRWSARLPEAGADRAHRHRPAEPLTRRLAALRRRTARAADAFSQRRRSGLWNPRRLDRGQRRSCGGRRPLGVVQPAAGRTDREDGALPTELRQDLHPGNGEGTVSGGRQHRHGLRRRLRDYRCPQHGLPERPGPGRQPLPGLAGRRRADSHRRLRRQRSR